MDRIQQFGKCRDRSSNCRHPNVSMAAQSSSHRSALDRTKSNYSTGSNSTSASAVSHNVALGLATLGQQRLASDPPRNVSHISSSVPYAWQTRLDSNEIGSVGVILA